MSEMTEFCALYNYILKHTSKKRGSIGEEGEKEIPEGEKRNSLV